MTLDSSELVVAFDADNQNTGAGFLLHYEISKEQTWSSFDEIFSWRHR